MTVKTKPVSKSQRRATASATGSSIYDELMRTAAKLAWGESINLVVPPQFKKEPGAFRNTVSTVFRQRFKELFANRSHKEFRFFRVEGDDTVVELYRRTKEDFERVIAKVRRKPMAVKVKTVAKKAAAKKTSKKVAKKPATAKKKVTKKPSRTKSKAKKR